MSFQKIRLEPFLDNQALRLVLASPPGNVLDAAMMAEIDEVLGFCAAQKQLKLLCFVGEGRHFSFGASVEEHVGDKAKGMLQAFHGMFRKMANLGLPTAAVVGGRCLGGGMELAAFCTRVVAAPTAIFAQPEIQLGVFPPIASLILPLKIGQAWADDLNLSGRNVEAAEALALGLVNEVAEDPMLALEAWAQRELAPKSAEALRHAARASRWQFNQALETQLDSLESFYLKDLMACHDPNEGLAAFLAKRKPEWKDA